MAITVTINDGTSISLPTQTASVVNVSAINEGVSVTQAASIFVNVSAVGATGPQGPAGEDGSGGISSLVADTTPQLGGNLDAQTNNITNLGSVNGTAASTVISGAASGATALQNIVSDTSPQLGGNLDVNGNKITSTSNGDIDIEPNGTGDVLLGNFKFDADQSVGAGQDNYVLTYDNSTTKISLEAAAGGSSNPVLLAAGTTQIRLNTNDQFFFGNDTYGWSQILWTGTPTALDSTVDSDAINGIICPIDATNINLRSSIERTSGNGTNCEMRLYKASRPNGSTSNISLTQLGSSATTGAFDSGTVYNCDIAATSITLSAGDLVFLMVKKTGGTDTTTYTRFNFSITVS